MEAFSDQLNNFAKVLCGRSLAEQQQLQISKNVQAHLAKGNRAPCLAVMLVCNNPSSAVYVAAKQKACEKVGIISRVLRFSQTSSQSEITDALLKLNNDQAVDGILIQLPLPSGFNANALLEILDPKKDVDGLTYYNLGRLMSKNQNFVPCTPLGCMDLITSVMPDISGKNAIVFGRSILVGRPMAILLEQAGATVTVVHSQSKDVAEISKQADIVIAAIGKPGFVTASYIKPGAVVIDVGITRMDGVLVGDVHESVKQVAGWLTPVPGGVGPMTITKLLSNTLKAAHLT
ncbi:MAG: bifunctional methylenetetrahydrofolate dehydrogenase/methenyltetrahydrofolate cyclohydrolase FolD [Alphaproteobacteria bacterium]